MFAEACQKLEFEKVKDRIRRYAVSDPGRARVDGLEPVANRSEIEHSLSRVSQMKRLLEQEGAIPLEGIQDVRSALQRSGVEGVVLQGIDLYHIGQTLAAGRTLHTFIGKRRAEYDLLWEMCEPVHVDKILEYNIERAVDESGAVRAGASRKLQSIRRAIGEKYDQLRRKLESVLKGVSELGFTQEDIITTREGRMVIPVKIEHKNKVPGFIHSASSSGATVFIEPAETLELNNDIRSLQFDEQREVQRILKELTEQVGKVRDLLLRALDALAGIDLVYAQAKYSIEVLGVQPRVRDTGPLRLVAARHPLLIQTHGYNGTVPLDLTLGDAFRTLVISGPNAGGKSVAMKCAGLLVLMAQAGIHIPASAESEVCIVERVFVDIGDEQSIENDLSSFSSHLANINHILASADERTLVLIDEIGSGTDPSEGGALAAAVLHSLTARGSLTIATTHHSVLKVFAHETESVENGAMEFDQKTLSPTYRLRLGTPGSSYALELARRQGLSETILGQARQFMGTQGTQLDELIRELEGITHQQKAEVDSLRRDKQQLDEMIRSYETKLASQAAELKETKRKALAEAQSILEQANAAVERSIREIREQSAGRESIKHAKARLESVRREVAEASQSLAPDEKEEAFEIAAGSSVLLSTGGEVGEVESVSPDGKSAVVAFGSVRMRALIADLKPAKRRDVRTSAFVPLQEEKKRSVKDLDLRGMTGDEAIPLVDKFIDDAMLSGLCRIDIIHGKGTGALRKKIMGFLSSHPRVKSFRPAEWNEGGMGATVVELEDNE